MSSYADLNREYLRLCWLIDRERYKLSLACLCTTALYGSYLNLMFYKDQLCMCIANMLEVSDEPS